MESPSRWMALRTQSPHGSWIHPLLYVFPLPLPSCRSPRPLLGTADKADAQVPLPCNVHLALPGQMAELSIARCPVKWWWESLSPCWAPKKYPTALGWFWLPVIGDNGKCISWISALIFLLLFLLLTLGFTCSFFSLLLRQRSLTWDTSFLIKTLNALNCLLHPTHFGMLCFHFHSVQAAFYSSSWLFLWLIGYFESVM